LDNDETQKFDEFAENKKIEVLRKDSLKIDEKLLKELQTKKELLEKEILR